MDTAQLKKVYNETIAPALQKQFNYSSAMQIPVLKKIVINQGLGDATQDKKIIDVAINQPLPVRRLLLHILRRISQTSSCVRRCLSVSW